jgi:hypothetical protein
MQYQRMKSFQSAQLAFDVTMLDAGIRDSVGAMVFSQPN